MSEQAIDSTPVRDRKKILVAVLPLAVVPLAILCAALGVPSLAAVVLGALLASVFLPDFVQGRTGRLTREGRPWGAVFRPKAELQDWAARLYAGRFVAAGVVLAVGGIVETVWRGWFGRFFGDGNGFTWALLGGGAFMAATAVANVAPPVRNEVYQPGPLPTRVLAWVVNGIVFVIATSVAVAALIELLSPGSVTDWIRGLNPLASP